MGATPRVLVEQRPGPPPLRGPRTRFVLFVVGFSPITALALSLLEVLPLSRSGPVVIVAVPLALVVLAVVRPGAGRLACRGLLTGLIAVLIYDGTRLPFVVLGGWPDFIPRIGDWLLDGADTHWSVGYAWRYLGNGAGMGLGFTALHPLLVRRARSSTAGVAYGVAIWSGLLTTLLLAPHGEEKMFVISPATLVLSLLGHLVYGGVLGRLAAAPSAAPTAPPRLGVL